MITVSQLPKPLSEAEITRHWRYTDKVYISCICITFNQEAYIAEAIDSMLAQQTEYKFEIVIHDDCSTDKTRAILVEYQQQFPNIIKLVLQETNQYSLGKRIIPLAVAASTGELLAICEGDDFWINQDKLQKQITILNSNHNVALCIHRAYKKVSDNYLDWGETDHGELQQRLSVDDVITSMGQYAPTASYFMRKEVMEAMPAWVNQAPVGDFLIEVYSKTVGDIYYIPDVMSVYRAVAIGSWSQNQLAIPAKKIVINKKMIAVYNYMKADTKLNLAPELFKKREKRAYMQNIKFAIALKSQQETRENAISYLQYLGYSQLSTRLISRLVSSAGFICLVGLLKKKKKH